MRRYLCDASRIDLVGPRPGDAALQHERLPQAPSRWYLTGFLAPGDAPEEQLAQDSEEALDEPAEPLHGSDDASTPDRGSHKRLFLPSSMGLSLLVDEKTNRLDVAVSWGDYAPEIADTPDAAGGPESAGGAREAPAESGASAAAREGDGSPEDENPPEGGQRARRFAPWVRRPGSGAVAIDLDACVLRYSPRNHYIYRIKRDPSTRTPRLYPTIKSVSNDAI